MGRTRKSPAAKQARQQPKAAGRKGQPAPVLSAKQRRRASAAPAAKPRVAPPIRQRVLVMRQDARGRFGKLRFEWRRL